MKKRISDSRLFLLSIMFLIVFFACGKKEETKEQPATDSVPATEEAVTALPDVPDLPPGVGRRIKVNNIGALATVFNDSNNSQLQMAQKYGIDPITDLRSAYFAKRPLVKISDTENYKLDSLRHSLPYLVVEAADLLDVIGKAFRDSLTARGGDSYTIKVTSLLRTPETVGRLRRVNVNATDSSTHQYATTFDLSYVNFYCADSTRMIYQGDLKNLLAEVLLDLRKQGKCLVKYERKTGCFHITVAG